LCEKGCGGGRREQWEVKSAIMYTRGAGQALEFFSSKPGTPPASFALPQPNPICRLRVVRSTIPLSAPRLSTRIVSFHRFCAVLLCYAMPNCSLRSLVVNDGRSD
jgi:hypothetical protein